MNVFASIKNILKKLKNKVILRNLKRVAKVNEDLVVNSATGIINRGGERKC